MYGCFITVLALLIFSSFAKASTYMGGDNEFVIFGSFVALMIIFWTISNYKTQLPLKERKIQKKIQDVIDRKRLTVEYNNFEESILRSDMKKRGFEDFNEYENVIDTSVILAKAFCYADEKTKKKFKFCDDIFHWFGDCEEILNMNDYH